LTAKKGKAVGRMKLGAYDRRARSRLQMPDEGKFDEHCGNKRAKGVSWKSTEAGHTQRGKARDVLYTGG